MIGVLRALHDKRVAALQPVDPDLARVAWRELGAMLDKLERGEPWEGQDAHEKLDDLWQAHAQGQLNAFRPLQPATP